MIDDDKLVAGGQGRSDEDVRGYSLNLIELAFLLVALAALCVALVMFAHGMLAKCPYFLMVAVVFLSGCATTLPKWGGG